jgi:tRNA G37 N-methylase Trm5
VKLDEGAWNTTPPEQISEFIAGKCAGGKVILDAFAGAGGTAIKLAGVSSCSKVISNDWNGSRLTCLLNNAKVYEVERNI